MSDGIQYKAKGGGFGLRISDEPPGYDISASSEKLWNQKYREWLRRRGFHAEADAIQLKSDKQKAKYARNKTPQTN